MPAHWRASRPASVNYVVVEQIELRQSRLELLGRSAAGIAHDLNNQFTLILNHLALENVEPAREAVLRCVLLTSGLLAYCRGEYAPLRPTRLAAAVFNYAKHAGIPAGVKLVLDIGIDAATVPGDETSIERALDNLVRNASKAMNGAGSISIAVRGATIEVQDSGPGIAPENLHRIFEPFFSTGGHGLGLAIVRDIMRQHGGSVTVSSQPGHGAKFTLHFRTPRTLL